MKHTSVCQETEEKYKPSEECRRVPEAEIVLIAKQDATSENWSVETEPAEPIELKKNSLGLKIRFHYDRAVPKGRTAPNIELRFIGSESRNAFKDPTGVEIWNQQPYELSVGGLTGDFLVKENLGLTENPEAESGYSRYKVFFKAKPVALAGELSPDDPDDTEILIEC